MSTCIILGDRSDIASALRPMLEEDGWKVIGWHRGNSIPALHWDLMLIAVGAVAPVGHWWELDEPQLITCIDSNLILPLTYLRRMWHQHNPGAYVCWLAGSNPNTIMDGYSAYNISKMAVLKAVEQLDHESPDCTFFALGPGTILTKIHDATIDAQWPNPKLDMAMLNVLERSPSKAVPRVYECIKWCLKQPKSVIGGRNICVSDPWDASPEALAAELDKDQDAYKLRRKDGV